MKHAIPQLSAQEHSNFGNSGPAGLQLDQSTSTTTGCPKLDQGTTSPGVPNWIGHSPTGVPAGSRNPPTKQCPNWIRNRFLQS
ncbi:hypothetical protein TNIN_391081 [Trichonephila inaurata madagascariensis]|uniref:Uncharacterized protein n=1 Tax=Trichonephila inaurata madagascariensis TaxID=2747483 RepID=A0A8X6YAV1_9ARAC|nr:hypothetical protein TNIN_391081 [Trichonephila inaurata madagascariensis]